MIYYAHFRGIAIIYTLELLGEFGLAEGPETIREAGSLRGRAPWESSSRSWRHPSSSSRMDFRLALGFPTLLGRLGELLLMVKTLHDLLFIIVPKLL